MFLRSDPETQKLKCSFLNSVQMQIFCLPLMHNIQCIKSLLCLRADPKHRKSPELCQCEKVKDKENISRVIAIKVIGLFILTFTEINEHALCHCITPKDDRVTTLCTPWTTPMVTVERNSYVHTQNHVRMLTV